MKNLITWVVFFTFFNAALGARILALLPIPAKSHHILFQAILRTLAQRGHEVVCYTTHPLAQPVANYTEIDLEIGSVQAKLTRDELFDMINWPSHRVSLYLMELAIKLMENVLENKKIINLINSTEKFDLIMVEAFYAQEAFLGFGHKFKAPVINIHPFGAHAVASLAAGTPLNLVSVPDYPIPYSNDMSFLQRFHNAFTKLFPFYTYYTQSLPYQQQVMTKAFKDPTMPPIEQLISNISLYLNNGNPYVDYPQPYTPNVVPVGGIHLASERNPLPPEIKTFLDEAAHGVIYFSLGSVLPDQLLGTKFFQNFINVFRRLPQRVLWKTNSEYKNIPANVMTAKWVPQQDVLAHPNVVVFLTHGGLFSLHEAVDAGVPVVCIPFFVDQPMNAMFYEAKQVGVRLLFDTVSEETISSALQTVINDRKYKDNMRKLSSISRDQPQSPADRAVYWVEYVLRHGGTQHLTPASARMSWYQLWLLDVVAALLVAAAALSAAVYLAVSRLAALCRQSLGSPVDEVKKLN